MDALLPSALLEKPLEEYEEGEAAIAFLLELFFMVDNDSPDSDGEIQPPKLDGFSDSKIWGSEKKWKLLPPKVFPGFDHAWGRDGSKLDGLGPRMPKVN